jgi:hypothetical protein
MGRSVINMAVRGDSGRAVAQADGGLEWTAAFEELSPVEFPMLWALDPYGDAVFNKRQVPLLLAELDRLPAPCADDWVSQAASCARSSTAERTCICGSSVIDCRSLADAGRRGHCAAPSS